VRTLIQHTVVVLGVAILSSACGGDDDASTPNQMPSGGQGNAGGAGAGKGGASGSGGSSGSSGSTAKGGTGGGGGKATAGTGGSGKAGASGSSSGDDRCPDDPIKTEPGVCGCGSSDSDADSNGIIDCLEDPDWTDVRQWLVPSDGSHSLGAWGGSDAQENTTRDTGSKLLYFDTEAGDNAGAQVYWWDGKAIVDSDGNDADPATGETYGADPLNPNEKAVRAFKTATDAQCNAGSDLRLETHGREFGCLARGFPDWFLFRRGQRHTEFDAKFEGGRSEDEPLVVAAYGPLGDGRATIDKSDLFKSTTAGVPDLYYHIVFNGLNFGDGYAMLGGSVSESTSGGPLTLHFEDCKFAEGDGNRFEYLVSKAVVRRSIIAFSWDGDAHNQGYYTSEDNTNVLFDEDIFYKNGYKGDPLLDPDPKRDVFSRNIYEGGGGQMAHTYRNIISADGASGGPQMRYGGLIENSLIIEGYWFSSTDSNEHYPAWVEGQMGQSAVVRNNVGFILRYPTAKDPDTSGGSDENAAPGDGYTLQSASFGAAIENNIISGAMLTDELGGEPLTGLKLSPARTEYDDGNSYTMKDNTFRGNIVYGVSTGLGLENDWIGTEGNVVEDNVFAVDRPVAGGASNIATTSQLVLQNNRFYSSSGLPTDAYMGDGNTLGARADAASSEKWSDPDRTLKRYVTEELGLTLLDWADDDNLDPTLSKIRSDAGEEYDPTGMKTFMAVATNMRRGGVDEIPTSGKPSLHGDYPWDARFTGTDVVNWIREGFGLDPVR